MKKNDIYVKPETEVIELEAEGIIAGSDGDSFEFDSSDEGFGGEAGSTRGFWDGWKV